MKAYKCDRCGKFYVENDIALKKKCLGSTGVIITKAEVPVHDADICDNCLSNFILWWKDDQK